MREKINIKNFGRLCPLVSSKLFNVEQIEGEIVTIIARTPIQGREAIEYAHQQVGKFCLQQCPHLMKNLFGFSLDDKGGCSPSPIKSMNNATILAKIR